jgi:GST-like protein
LFWQVGGLGPIAGQAHHFRLYAPVKDDYAIDRYTKETHKFYAVLESQLSRRPFIAGDLSIADIAILPWIFRHQRQGVDLERYPAVKAWYAGLMARPEVIRGFEVGQSLINQGDFSADEARSHLF